MGISYNNIDINVLNYNAGALQTAYYNNGQVWPDAELVDYVFPNDTAKLTANGDYGIYAYANKRNALTQDDWYALDGKTTTAWMLYYSDLEQIIVVFPFRIQLQSITIVNRSTTYASTSSTLNGLETGSIYTSSVSRTSDEWETIATDPAKTLADYMDFLMDVDRAQPSGSANLAGYSTTHDNPDQSGKWIYAVGILGSSWGPGGGSSWKSIAEINISFKAKSTDLIAAGLT